ncbi:MAG: hypothetical protein V3V10_09405 [Planctomycetota bacterium]
MRYLHLILIALTFALVGCVGSKTVADDTIYSYELWENKTEDISDHEIKAHRAFYHEHIEAAHEAAGYSPEESSEIASKAIQEE